MPSNFHPEGEPSNHDHGDRPDSVPSWVGSLSNLIHSRIELMQLEARQVITDGMVRGIMLIASALMVVVTWFLLMAAVVGLVQAFTGFAWYWTCLAMGGIHLLAILAMIRRARAPRPPAFQHTRSEFQQDREWLKNLQHRKSKR